MGVKQIKLPDLGEGVLEGEIIKILVSQGENIVMDQPLVEVMTDKASMEVPSSIDGLVEKVEIAPGDVVGVGSALFTVKTKDSLPKKSPSSSKTGFDAQKPPLKESRGAMPSAKEGKALAQKPSSPLAKKDQQEPSLKEPRLEKKLSAKEIPAKGASVLALPSTRKLAEELGLGLESIKGSGPQGEIKREDLIQHVRSALRDGPFRSESMGGQAPPEKAPISFEEAGRRAVRGVQRLMMKSMALSKATVPHFTVGEKVLAEKLIALRGDIKARLEKQAVKVGFLAFFVRALIPALKEFPLFNSAYDPQSNELVFRKDINIGFAVDSPQGLLVPVLKQAQNLSLLEIIKQIAHLAERARKGSLQREDLTGASITVTNLGSLGGLYGTPIINPPEMAIVGIYRLSHSLARSPKDGSIEEKPFFNCSLTCDHRFIDGATAVRFLKNFLSRVEEPGLMLLE